MDVQLIDPKKFCRRESGYSLPELLLGLALSAILLTWGIPGFVRLYQNDILTTETNKLLTALFRARSESIKSNEPVVICRSDDGQYCLRSDRARADWSVGWLIFVNTDDDKNRDPSESILFVSDEIPDQVSIFFNNWWRISYRPTGSNGNGSFTLCNDGSAFRVITVYRTGRTRLSEPAPWDPDVCRPS